MLWIIEYAAELLNTFKVEKRDGKTALEMTFWKFYVVICWKQHGRLHTIMAYVSDTLP